MQNIFNYWEKFRALSYSDELLIAGGAVLLLISVVKIFKASATTLFWVVASGLGLAGMSQGLDRNPLLTAAARHSPVAGYVDSTKELSNDALGILCRKLEETEMLQLE